MSGANSRTTITEVIVYGEVSISIPSSGKLRVKCLGRTSKMLYFCNALTF